MENEEIKSLQKPEIFSWEAPAGLWFAIRFAIAWCLCPVMIILAAILRRKITWYK